MKIQKYIVTEDMSIIDAMKAINDNVKGIVFVCNMNQLMAVVTDGDIRRYILKNGNLDNPIKEIANYNPHYVYINEKVEYMKYMKKHSITALPIVDKDMNITHIEFLYNKDNYPEEKIEIPVVIMAGGKGTRLYPYTDILPKPLIPIGDKTITERIMDKFESFGCKEFNMIVNYKKNLIKAFFMDNENPRCIEFTEEATYLGTGGGLKLLKGRYNTTFFMTNCDILIDEDYTKIYEFHKKQKNTITIVSAIKNITIPYGTIEVSDNGQVKRLIEKPNFSFLTNTGLYIIEPEFLEKIPKDTFIHITDVIQNCLDSNDNVGFYPISEHSWLDMGQIEELEKMKDRLNADA